MGQMSRIRSYLTISLVILAQAVASKGLPEVVSEHKITRTRDELDLERRNYILAVHAVCGFLAFQVFAPIAVVVASVGRSFGPVWFKIHYRTQIWIVVPLAILGFVLLGTLLLQVLVGAWAHIAQKIKRENAREDAVVEVKRRARNWVHIIVGIALLSLGGLQVTWGLEEWSRYVGPIPLWITLTHWILAGVPVFIVTPFVVIRGALRMHNGQTFAQAFFDRPASSRQYVPPRKLFLGSSTYRSVGTSDEKEEEQEGLIWHAHRDGQRQQPSALGGPEAEWVGATTRGEYEASLLQARSRSSMGGTSPSPAATVSEDRVSSLHDRGGDGPAPSPLPQSRYPPTPLDEALLIDPDFPPLTFSPLTLPVSSPQPPSIISPRLAFMPFPGTEATRAGSSATPAASPSHSTPSSSIRSPLASDLSNAGERHVTSVPAPSMPIVEPSLRRLGVSTSAAAVCSGDSVGVPSSSGITRHVSMAGEIVKDPTIRGEYEATSFESTVEEEVKTRHGGAEGHEENEGPSIAGDDDSTRLMDELERELSVSSVRSHHNLESPGGAVDNVTATEETIGLDVVLARQGSGNWFGSKRESQQ
ncbi:hypothetical protein JCM16303_007263 [Sporobolomyces ruberrimus]